MALEPIHTVVGRGVVVPGHDIDTDRIIPARFMKCVTFDGLGEYLFYDSRYFEDGSPKDHPLNDERFAGATIVLSGANFGCGSSREHAPQALYRHGVRAVVAQSFAEIFFGNSVTLGMPCVEADADTLAILAEMIESDPATEIVIDLEGQRLVAGDKAFVIRVPESARDALLGGRWDPIKELLEGADEVTSTARRLAYLPDGR